MRVTRCRADLRLALWLALCAALAGLPAPRAARLDAQGSVAFVPVAVQYRTGDDPRIQRRDLEEIRRLRFNVVELVTDQPEREHGSLVHIDRLLAGSPDPRVLLPLDAPPATIPIAPETSAGQLSVEAWSAIARGKRGVIFASWTTLLANADALAAAAQFAEAITRNAALYGPLRTPAASGAGRRVQVAGEAVEATLLESTEALVLIAVNRSAGPQHATITFSPDVPEAIWQNMLAGGAVSFVAGPAGPVYDRTFLPHDVLVLAIKKVRS